MGASFDAGDHAFVSYGPVSNDDLLQFYGFVERDNPSDAYVLEDMGKWLREVCLLSSNSSRLDYLWGSCFDTYGSVFVRGVYAVFRQQSSQGASIPRQVFFRFFCSTLQLGCVARERTKTQKTLLPLP